MKIRLLTSISGGDMNFEEGREYEVDDGLGKLLCAQPEDAPRAEVVAQKPIDKRETRKVAA